MTTPPVGHHTRWQRNTEVLSATIGDELLVFDALRRQAHLLNPSAAATWVSCNGTADVSDVVDQLAVQFAVDATEIDDDVRTIVGQLVERGLLVCSASQVEEATPPGRAGPDDAADPRALAHASSAPDPFVWGGPLPDALDHIDWPHIIGPYRALHVDVDIACTDPLIARHLARVLRPLESAGPARHRYRVATTPEGGPAPLPDGEVIAFDDLQGESPTDPERAVAWVLWHLNTLVSTTATDRLHLHASGAADRAGRVVAFPAEMNSGKSTLVAGLVQRGLHYVTDETVAIDPDSLTVAPYPKAIGLDPGSWPVLADLEPELPHDEASMAATKWYVDPSQVGSIAGPGPLSLVIFPTYDPARPTELVALSPTQAATRLAECAFNLDRLGQRGLDTLVAIATTTPAFALSVHDLASACATVEDVMRQLDDPDPSPGVPT
jgi:hypothetical protein